jgi:hypothetical protein
VLARLRASGRNSRRKVMKSMYLGGLCVAARRRPVHGLNFVELEAKAVRQREAIEERRRALVERTFSATDPRTE